MSKYDLSWTEEKYNKRVKDGRGQGTGTDYKPWITVHDFPSDGLASRSPGWKSSRVYHFMSTNELRYFYILEWVETIIDIREQFPLELEDTLRIAENLGIKHPIDNISKFPRVLTTDFLLTLKSDNSEKFLARTIKQAKDLEIKRTIEKFEIERQYWFERNIDWKVVTEKDISKEFAGNVEWVHTEYRLEPIEKLGINDLTDICEILKGRLSKNECVIYRITSDLDKELNIEKGTCLTLFRHLLAKKDIVMDMTRKIGAGDSTSQIIKIKMPGDKVKAL